MVLTTRPNLWRAAMFDCDQKHSSRNRRRLRFRRRFRRRFDRVRVKGIAGEKVELEPAECERIERVLGGGPSGRHGTDQTATRNHSDV